jgi:pyruvate formate lyase activating enzyme
MVKIGGIQKMTLLDYPGKVAATIFTLGCNFHCGFCHNPELVEITDETNILPEEEVLQYLDKRKNVLDGVCITGGEPLLYKDDLIKLFKKIKKLGYLIKLDTNGSDPESLQELIDNKFIDYIAMDIKTSLDKYSEIVGKVDVNKILKSIKLIMSSGLDYEFRTTVLPRIHSLEDIEKIAKMIKGANHYYLQNFNNKKTLDENWQNELSFTDEVLEKMKKISLKYVNKCEIRR